MNSSTLRARRCKHNWPAAAPAHPVLTRLPTHAQVVAHRMGLVVPDELRKERWDWLVILFVLYNAVEVPFDLCFSPDANTFLTVFDYFVDVTFMIDIFIAFRTTYYDKKRQLVLDRELVRRKYLRAWFVPDLLATIPYELFFLMGGVNVGATSAMGLAKLPRLLRLGRHAAEPGEPSQRGGGSAREHLGVASRIRHGASVASTLPRPPRAAQRRE